MAVLSLSSWVEVLCGLWVSKHRSSAELARAPCAHGACGDGWLWPVPAEVLGCALAPGSVLMLCRVCTGLQ